MTQFIAVGADGRVLYACGRPDPADFVGPLPPPPNEEDGIEYFPWQQPLAFGSAPSLTSVLRWNGVAPAWVENDSTIDACRQRRWALIKAARDAALAGGFTFGCARFDSDAVSIGRITGAAMLAMMAVAAGEPYSVTWVLADNTTRTLDGAGTMALGAAAGLHVQRIVDQGQALREQLDAATSHPAIEAVVWPEAL